MFTEMSKEASSPRNNKVKERGLKRIEERKKEEMRKEKERG